MKDPQYELFIGDAREVLPTLPEHSVDAIMTSPPYWGLRSYKADSLIWNNHTGCCHEWGSELIRRDRGAAAGITAQVGNQKKAISGVKTYQGNFCLKCGAWRGQLGSEPDPDLFIKHLCDIFDLCKRVLKKTGSLWVNLDDSFAGSGQGGGGGSISNDRAEIGIQRRDPPKNIPAKSLCAIPERFILEMLKRGWIYRQCIIWQKPSTMPESVKDRMTRDFEYLYHFTQQGKYFFERQFELGHSWGTRDRSNYRNGTDDPLLLQHGLTEDTSSLGRNKRSVWSINPEPQKSVKKGAVAHYAAFPTALCTIPILSTVPEQICTKCGVPRVKIYESTITPQKSKRNDGDKTETFRNFDGERWDTEVKEVGLSDCGCGAPFEPGIILDPFGGTGTVAVEARKLGRRAMLIEVSEQYSKLIQSRLEKIPIPMNLE